MKTAKLIATAPFIIVFFLVYGILSLGTLIASCMLAVLNELLSE